MHFPKSEVQPLDALPPRSASGPPTHHINNLLFNIIHCPFARLLPNHLPFDALPPVKYSFMYSIRSTSPFTCFPKSKVPPLMHFPQDLPLAHPPITSSTFYLTEFIVPFPIFLDLVIHDAFQCKDFLIVILSFIVNGVILFSVVILLGSWLPVCLNYLF